MTADERGALLSRAEHGEEGQRNIVNGDSPVDEESEDLWNDPKGWSAPFKWSLVALLSFLAFSVYVSGQFILHAHRLD